jgi:hypothetical protein
MALEIFELLGGFSSAADGLAAIIYSGLRLMGVPEEKSKKISERLVIILFGLILVGVIYSAFKYL